MSAWIVALLTEAYDKHRPPAGTHEQRLTHFLRRKRELEGRTELPLEPEPAPVDDSQLDAELARLCADPEAQPFAGGAR